MIKKHIRKAAAFIADLPVIGEIFTIRPKVAVIRLSGIITDSATRRQNISAAKYETLIEDAFDVHNLKAVALVINCPGGAPAQTQIISTMIRAAAEEKNIPVYAFVEDVAASGGYWLACAADKIYVQGSSIVGSIGVISASFGFEELIKRYGVERRVHTAGKDKSFLDPFAPEKPEDIKRLKEIQKDIHEQFKTWVRERRGDVLKGSDKDLFEGQFWTGEAALLNGTADEIGDVRGTCRALLGEDIKFISFAPDKGWFSGLLGTDISQGGELAGLIEERSARARFGL